MKTPEEVQRELDKVVPLRKAEAPPKEVEQPPARAVPPIKAIRFPELAGRVPPDRVFIVDQWLPAGCVTSLYGPGGIGKSLLAQMMGTAVALGRPLFEMQVRKGPVLGLMAEDDDDELWRRQIRINEWIACEMGDLGNLHLQGRAGLENTLAVYPSTGAPLVEPFFDLVREAGRTISPVLIILDPIAQLFGGNENDRFQVSHFINLAGSLAREFSCAVLLLGHPAKAEESEYSGSTAWNASVRSRLLLKRKEGEDSELLLSRTKSNYAMPEALPLKWQGGVLRPVAAKFMSYGDKLDAEMRAGAAQAAFLSALDLLTKQGVALSDAARAGNYAPRELERHHLLGDFTKREMEEAMIALIGRGVLAANMPIGGKKKNRQPRCGLARLNQGEEE